MDQETDRKTDRNELQIQGLEQHLDQLCMWLARLFFAVDGEPSSEHYFLYKPLLTEACSDASDAEVIGDYITITLRVLQKLQAVVLCDFACRLL